jgi:hypothetical protein
MLDSSIEHHGTLAALVSGCLDQNLMMQVGYIDSYNNSKLLHIPGKGMLANLLTEDRVLSA